MSLMNSLFAGLLTNLMIDFLGNSVGFMGIDCVFSIKLFKVVLVDF